MDHKRLLLDIGPSLWIVRTTDHKAYNRVTTDYRLENAAVHLLVNFRFNYRSS